MQATVEKPTVNVETTVVEVKPGETTPPSTETAVEKAVESVIAELVMPTGDVQKDTQMVLQGRMDLFDFVSFNGNAENASKYFKTAPTTSKTGTVTKKLQALTKTELSALTGLKGEALVAFQRETKADIKVLVAAVHDRISRDRHWINTNNPMTVKRTNKGRISIAFNYEQSIDALIDDAKIAAAEGISIEELHAERKARADRKAKAEQEAEAKAAAEEAAKVEAASKAALMDDQAIAKMLGLDPREVAELRQDTATKNALDQSKAVEPKAKGAK